VQICVAVGEKSINKLIMLISNVDFQADLIEFRLDYLEALDYSELEKLLEKMKLPVILTVRRKNEGGKFKGSEEDRSKILKTLIDLRPDFIDIELSSPFLTEDFADSAKRVGVKIIGSYHSFQDTPPIHVLLRKIDMAYRLGLDVVKIVTYAKEIEDNLIILSLHSAAGKYLRGME